MMANSAKNQQGLSRTLLIRLIRRLPEYEAWKRAVHIRDRFACQECGKRNGRKRVIEADHIKPLSQLVKELEVTSVEQAASCLELWDISNGRTLCETCHRATPSYPQNFQSGGKKKRVFY
jgi:5-methylcytosine-specific restriction endonuclease McrA